MYTAVSRNMQWTSNFVQVLLNLGSDIKAVSPTGETLLSIAKKKSDQAVISLLESHGALY
jgi:ankyrin repeat protein